MRLSTKARYALRLMTDIAVHGDDGTPVQLREISKRQGISESYLGHIVVAMKNNFLLRGISGKNGGYKLSRDAGEIRVGEIIEAAIGPINIVDCARDPNACDKSDACESREIFTLVNERIFETFNSYTLSNMVDMRNHRLSAGAPEEDCSTCSRRDLCSSNFR